jgi:dCTP deaminase
VIFGNFGGQGAGILTGKQVEKEVDDGGIVIEPFYRECLNPVSVDLHLGEHAAVYSDVSFIKQVDRSLDERVGFGEIDLAFMSGVLDARKENPVVRFDIPKEGLVLRPGCLYLMHTLERVHTRHFVPVLDGKSSIGRLGIKVHETAGYGDPGFDGQYTLEVTCVHPVRVYAGMRFCQIRFHTMVGEVELYGHRSNYVGTLAKGPVPSRSFKQFEKDDGQAQK